MSFAYEIWSHADWPGCEFAALAIMVGVLIYAVIGRGSRSYPPAPDYTQTFGNGTASAGAVRRSPAGRIREPRQVERGTANFPVDCAP